MLYIVRVFEDGEIYEYEYESLRQAEERYEWEKSAEIWLYAEEKETLIRRK